MYGSLLFYHAYNTRWPVGGIYSESDHHRPGYRKKQKSIWFGQTNSCAVFNLGQNVATGKWGRTFFGGRAVRTVIFERIPATVLLMGTAMSFALLIGVFVGVLGAYKRYSIFDYLATVGAMVALSFPTFWFGLMAIFIFGVKLGWFPTGGMYSLGMDVSILDLLRHLVLPALVLSLILIAQWARYTGVVFLMLLTRITSVQPKVKESPEPGYFFLVHYPMRRLH